MKIIAQQQETLDMICQRYYGRTADVTESTLNANPGLADLGVFVPYGYAVDMPDQVPPSTRDTVQLWD